MARPSSRLLSRTTTSRTMPVFAAETGSDTGNVDARDIVEGRVAEIGFICQIPNCQLPTPKEPDTRLGRWELGVGSCVSELTRWSARTALPR
jgi:hypothetical protein